MTEDKCLVTVSSKADLEKLQEENDLVWEVYTREGCHHCEETKPYIKRKCKELGADAPVAVANCPVDKKFCRERALPFKPSGVPFSVLSLKGNPVTTITGKDIEKINKEFLNIKNILNKARREAVDVMKRDQYQQPYHDAPARQPMPIRMPHGRNIVDVGMNNTSYPRLCTPGFDCSNQEFEREAVRALLMSKPESERKFKRFSLD